MHLKCETHQRESWPPLCRPTNHNLFRLPRMNRRHTPVRAAVLSRPPARANRRAMIVLEFNELSPALMDTFIDQGYLPNFKRLRDASQVFTTVAEEVAPNLDPWIQWVTVHSGLSYDEHGIFHLGDGHKLAVKSLWDLIAARGKNCLGVGGSMNIKYDTPVRGGGRSRTPGPSASVRLLQHWIRTICSCSATFRNTPTIVCRCRRAITCGS